MLSENGKESQEEKKLKIIETSYHVEESRLEMMVVLQTNM